MNKWYIYLHKGLDRKTKEPYISRHYYKKLMKTSEDLIYVGEATLSDEYFIIGSETHSTDIIDLRDVEVEYTAVLHDGVVSTFSHTFQDMLVKAKEGLMPYISFSGFRVNRKPKLIIKGKRHKVHNTKIIDYE